jgi:hypothetical protein
MMTLDNLGNGAAKELFEDALKKVIANIKDPNTDWKTGRAITLSVTFKPDEERNEVLMTISATPKLAPPKPFQLKALVGMHKDGTTEAHEFQTPKLPGCEDAEETDEKKVYKIKKEETGS